MIIKNIPAFIAGLAGVGGFQHEGSTAVALAVNAGMRGGRSISKMGGMTARAAQGISQGAQAVNKSVQLGRFAVSTTGVGAASQVASGALAKAALQSIKDGINKKNTHQSFGQRVNSHLANRIKKEKDNERE